MREFLGHIPKFFSPTTNKRRHRAKSRDAERLERRTLLTELFPVHQFQPAIFINPQTGSENLAVTDAIETNASFSPDSSAFSGVVAIEIQVEGPNGTARYGLGSGTLITDYHILTAAHNLDLRGIDDGSFGNGIREVPFDNIQIKFPGVDKLYGVSNAVIHPDYDGYLNPDSANPSLNDDIAVITLSERAPASAVRYDLADLDGNEQVEPQEIVFAGYGRFGTGADGTADGPTDDSFRDHGFSGSVPELRLGRNLASIYLSDDEGTGTNEVWVADFDGPSSDSDTLDDQEALSTLLTEARGDDLQTVAIPEAGLGAGDSGGPAFLWTPSSSGDTTVSPGELAYWGNLTADNPLGQGISPNPLEGKTPDGAADQLPDADQDPRNNSNRRYGSWSGGMVAAAYADFIGRATVQISPITRTSTSVRRISQFAITAVPSATPVGIDDFTLVHTAPGQSPRFVDLTSSSVSTSVTSSVRTLNLGDATVAASGEYTLLLGGDAGVRSIGTVATHSWTVLEEPDVAADALWTSIDGNIEGGMFGGSPTSVGDINGDGFEDTAVTLVEGTDGRGEVVVLLGADEALPASLSLVPTERLVRITNFFNTPTTKHLGDFNDDGFDDVLITAPISTFSGSNMYVVYGSESLPGTVNDIQAVDIVDGFQMPFTPQFSNAVGVGDVNHDGKADIAVGVSRSVASAFGGATYGGVFVIYGGSGRLSGRKTVSDLEGRTAKIATGIDAITNAAALGDVNGDTIDDFAINYSHSSISVVFGRDRMMLPEQASVSDVVASGGIRINPRSSGRSDDVWFAQAAGDFNGDNLNDILVTGIPRNGILFLDSIHVVPGRTDLETINWDDAPDDVISFQGLDRTGAVSASNLNGDRYDDLIFDHTVDVAGSGRIARTVIYGSQSTRADLTPYNPESHEGITILASESASAFGTHVGHSKAAPNQLFVGAPGHDSTSADDVGRLWTLTTTDGFRPFAEEISVASAATVTGATANVEFLARLSEPMLSAPDADNFVASGTISGASVSAVRSLDDETYLVTVTVPSSASGVVDLQIAADANATDRSGNRLSSFVAITERFTYVADPTFVISGAPSLVEGNSGISHIEFPVDRTGNVAGAATVDYSVRGSGADPTFADDFAVGGLTGVVSFADRAAHSVIRIPVAGDVQAEPDETFTVTISNPSRGSIATAQAIGTIVNDDAPSVALTVDRTSLSENGVDGSATINATLSQASSETVTVSLAFTGTASAADYSTSANQIVIPPGSLSGSVRVDAVQDLRDEPNFETVIIDIESVSNAVESGPQQVTVRIQDDDPLPRITLSANETRISEDTATSVVSANLSNASDLEVTIDVTYSGSATRNVDYTASTNRLTIPPGQTRGTFNITTRQDDQDELDEWVDVSVAGVVNGSHATGENIRVTIVDDDATSSVVVPQSLPYSQSFDSTRPEAGDGWEYYSSDPNLGRVRVSNGELQLDVNAVASYNLNEAILHLDLTGHENVKLQFLQANYGDEANLLAETFSGHSNQDGVFISTNGDFWYRLHGLSFSSTSTVTINDILKDLRDVGEADFSNVRIKFQQYDNYAINPTGISDGRGFDNIVLTASPLTEFSIAATAANRNESDFGLTPFTFTVTRDGDTSSSATVNYAVSAALSRSADASDFPNGFPFGTVSFLPGQSSRVVTVNVSGDTEVESDEVFLVTISQPSVGTIDGSTAIGRIQTDDVAHLSLFVATSTLDEDDAPVFAIVSRNGATTAPLTVNLNSSDTSEARVDDTATIPAGAASVLFPITPVHDSLVDGNTTVTISVAATGYLSAERNVTVRNIDSVIASATNITAPRASTTDRRPQFVWQPLPNAASYALWVNDVTNRSRVIYEEAVSGTSFTPASDLVAATYDAWVRPTFTNGSLGGWSPKHQFEIVSNAAPPALPVVKTPTLSANRPTFRWASAERAVRYEIWVTEVATGTRVLHKTQLRGTSFTPQEDLNTGKHRLWMRAFGADGQDSGWTSATTFSVGAAVVPAKPALTGPATTSSDPTPTFSWTIDAATDHVELWVNRVTSESARVIHERQLNGTSFTSGNLFPGTYKAWMRSFNADGETEGWTAAYEFVIEGNVAVPERTRVTGPAATTPITRPTIQWEAARNAVRHELWVNHVESKSRSIHVTHSTGTGHTPDGALAPGNYVAWVRGFNAANQPGPWSAAYRFQIVSNAAPPEVPQVLGPNGDVSSRAPLAWRASARASTYNIWLTNVDTRQAQIVQQGVTETSFVPTTDLPAGRYRFWVEAVSAEGVKSGWSVAHEFAVRFLGNVEPTHRGTGDSPSVLERGSDLFPEFGDDGDELLFAERTETVHSKSSVASQDRIEITREEGVGDAAMEAADLLMAKSEFLAFVLDRPQ